LRLPAPVDALPLRARRPRALEARGV